MRHTILAVMQYRAISICQCKVAAEYRQLHVVLLCSAVLHCASCLQEVHALAAVGDHPNIVKYVTAWIEKDAAMDGEHLYIQLEACDTSLGNLRALKDETKEGQLLEILRQVTVCKHCQCIAIRMWSMFAADMSQLTAPCMNFETAGTCWKSCSVLERQL